jgi:hypothetical protein
MSRDGDTAAKLLSKDEARLAVKIAKVPDLTRNQKSGSV